MSWRFYSLAELADVGILLPPDGKPVAARFISARELKQTVRGKA